MEFGFWQLAVAVLVPGTLLASWIDYTQRRVPNWLNLALLLAGFVAQAAYFGWAGIATGAWGMLAGFGLLIVPWMMHGMGAGDVKLMAAIGVWLGPLLTLYAFALGAMMGGLAAVVMILSTGRLRMACVNLGVILAKCTNRQTMFSEFGSARSFGTTSQLLPYGVPLTAGALVVLAGRLYGWWGI
jgi:prepilin peptidase CpaA